MGMVEIKNNNNKNHILVKVIWNAPLYTANA